MMEEGVQDAIAETTVSLVDEHGMPTPQGWRKIGARLREPMPTKFYTARGKRFDFIDARQVMDRLDGVIGPGNWTDHYKPLENGAVECAITIFGVTKYDVGYNNNPEASEGDPQFEHEPLKAAYSDAFKRAAVKWGVGRFIYNLGPQR